MQDFLWNSYCWHVACALWKDACEIFLWDAREQYDVWLHTKVNFMSIIHHHQICYKIKKCSNFEQKQINRYTETGHRYITTEPTPNFLYRLDFEFCVRSKNAQWRRNNFAFSSNEQNIGCCNTLKCVSW